MRTAAYPPAAKRYLDLWKRHGHGLTREEFEDRFKLPKTAFKNYRYKCPGWYERYQLITADLEATVKNKPAAPIIPREPDASTGLWGWKAVFIKEWKNTGSRIEAVQAAGKTWSDVEDALENDDDFKDVYKSVQKMIVIHLEDSLVESGRSGKIAAITKVLEKMDPSWQKNVHHQHNVFGQVAFTPEAQQIAASSWRDMIEGEVEDVDEA